MHSEIVRCPLSIRVQMYRRRHIGILSNNAQSLENMGGIFLSLLTLFRLTKRTVWKRWAGFLRLE